MKNANITATLEEQAHPHLKDAEAFLRQIKSMLGKDYVDTVAIRKLMDKEKPAFRAKAALCFHNNEWRMAELILQVAETIYRAADAYADAINKETSASEHNKDKTHAHLGRANQNAEDIFTLRQKYAQKYGKSVQKMTAEPNTPQTPPNRPQKTGQKPQRQLDLF